MLGIVQTEKAKRLFVVEDDTFGVQFKEGCPCFTAGSSIWKGHITQEKLFGAENSLSVDESIHFHDPGEESCF